MEQAVRAKITSKGRVTLPKSLRDALNLERGSLVEFDIRNGEAVMRPAGAGFLARCGSITPRQKSEDWARVRAEIEKEVSERRARGWR